MGLINDYNLLSQSIVGYSIYGYHFDSSYQKIKYTKFLLNYYPHLKIKFKYALLYGLTVYLRKFKEKLYQKDFIQKVYDDNKTKLKNNITNIANIIHGNKLKLELKINVHIQKCRLNLINSFYMKKFKILLLYNIYIQKIILCYYSIVNYINKY
ncbi:hypothetical protein BCR36DRAFT_439720 [Piromyces finnis]|uniref:Uncharacterized protein n=1 Tax=Piromyces finnis TaxID=1754191 RepID=A0A1Y1VPH6_9FUNG|nr:hypothetical protein BCR36DRAFT_439720 [Piromyces finnis]|eukprot:ORX61160.1 hypothetical protein BCR36DRAFT_439720 [Piromyces finnis]